ncbi:MAG: trigger factor [Bacillota bacterium]|nr:trigger factor [Bacillota bacterium]
MKKNKKLMILVIALVVVLAVVIVAIVSCNKSMSYGDYDLDEYLKVGEYKGLEVAPYTVTVSQEDVDEQIQANLEAATSTQELGEDEAIADGDTANIDYVGRIDGKKFEGGSAEGSDLTIGSDSFIDGFEDGLIGHTTGEKVKLNLTFPEDYQEETLQGKDVVFTVTINSVSREVVPEYGLDFVQNTTEYETVEEYEAALKEQINAQKEEEAINEQKDKLWDQALQNTEVKKYPDRELNHYMQFNSDQIDDMADSYGMERADVLEGYEFGDEDEFAAVNEDSSKLRVKQEMLIEYIAKEEGLDYTDEEKEALIADFESQGYTAEAVETQTGRPLAEYVHIELLYEKVRDFLLENANITGEATEAGADEDSAETAE